MLNKDGELIGITTAIATADVGAEGLGFAIPINLALNIVEDLLDDGRVLHAFLGILGAQYFEVADDGARVFSGVYIEELYGPSNDMYAIGKAGALPGDIIKKVNENSVSIQNYRIDIVLLPFAGKQKRFYNIVEDEKIIHRELALFETAMGIVKNLMLGKNAKVKDLEKLDVEYNNSLYEVYMYKTKAKKSINEDVMLAKMSQAQHKLSEAKSKILQKL